MNAQTAFDNSIGETRKLIEKFLDYLTMTYGGKWQAVDRVEFSDADYDFYQNEEFKFYVETKFRYHNFGEYEEEKVPMRKFYFAYYHFTEYQDKTLYLVKWADEKIGWLKLYEKPKKELVKMVARRDRGKEQDEYALYDIRKFNVIN